MHYNGKNHSFSIDDFRLKVNKVVRLMKPHLEHFDSIVVRGNSGTVIGPTVAMKLKVPIVIVRKLVEESHRGGNEIINQDNMGKRLVFLDDFRSQGSTENHCREALEKWAANKSYVPPRSLPEIVGCFFYDDGGASFWKETTEGRVIGAN